MIVSVYGSSSPPPQSKIYLQAMQLGALLAEQGYTLVTGGYMGLMEAASRGAAEAGGKVIGITCDEIEAWRPAKANSWLTEEIRVSKMSERLLKIVSIGDAAIALPGGPGTLTEIALTWNLMQVQSLPQRPLILQGKAWRRTFSRFLKSQAEFVSTQAEGLVSFSGNNSETLKLLKALINKA